MDALPDELLAEILVRVPGSAALFRCGTVCKRWRRLVAEPRFVRRRWPDDARSSTPAVFGFFTQPPPSRDGGLAPVFVPGPRSDLGPGRRTISSFMRRHAAGLLDGAVPLASRGGLLLLRCAAQPDGRSCLGLDFTGTRAMSFAVCNLLSGTCDVLPAPPLDACRRWLCRESRDRLRFFCIAIVTGEDCGRQHRPPPPGCSTFFKVLILDTSQDDHRRYSLSTFSSGDSKWTAPTKLNYVAGAELGAATGAPLNSFAFVNRGRAHWLFSGEPYLYTILDVHVETGHASATEFQQPMNHHSFCYNDLPIPNAAIDGRLSLLFLHEDKDHLRVEIWTRQAAGGDGGGAGWLRAREMELIRPPFLKQIAPYYMCLDWKSGMFLIEDDRFGRLYMVDLGAGVVQELAGRFNGMCRSMAVPSMMDWSEFFMSRLGGQ